ncbi:SpoIIE family protein phosphatase [Pelagicoccus sp. NFK12]|uniref:SpoIIE family protein phosphatase n=1 Tax=Pelagicoccus enzymogenes TaxID=2773457 RepID=A0A927F5G3_9BACT|nr:SpoIIE family protein phosphatase [Pelagicoccus enzymogenes]MBD5778749.1 SpoIIE family protein phosphatase [Pelagicoccus enzymogenes]
MSSKPIAYHETGYCEFPAELERVAEVSALLKSFCQRNCLDETLWPQLDLAICECLNNAVEHGCEEDASLIVKVKWSWIDERLIVEVEDPGPYFEPASDASLPDDPTSESGRGYFIIQSIAESYTAEKTDYGHKVTLRFATHAASDILVKTEEMFSMLQNLSNDLNLAYAERDIIAGLAHDLTNCPAIETFIEKSVERLRGIVDITQANVWTLESNGNLENAYHECGNQMEIREAVIAPDQACACTTVIASEKELCVENCSHLDETDPLYEISGCAIVLPIVYQRDCLGTIALHAEETNKKTLFETALPLTRTFSQFLGLAYTSVKTFRHREEHERSQTQLQVAAEIQQSLLPSSYPSNQYCRSTGRCVAAMAVGGDYVDAIEIRDAGLLIVIADVMGKGVPAALLATIFRTAIRSRLNLAETPGWLLAKINKQIYDELGHLNMFITAQAAFLSYDKKVLKLASAGHCPAILLDSQTQETQLLEAEGMPLGIAPDDLYEENLIQLSDTSKLLFITDGFYEAENPKGDMLGMDRLLQAIPDIWRDGLESVPSKAFGIVSKFANGRSATDDQTMMALEIL